MVYLSEHLKKYPLMETTDIIKLHLQGLLGPGHLVLDRNRVLNNLKNEYEIAKDINYSYDLIEKISDKYVRVYIVPYFNKFGNFEKLADAFVKSSHNKYDIEKYKEEIRKLITKENKKKIEEYLNLPSVLISHSSTYKENYFPHYLVVDMEYLDEIIN